MSIKATVFAATAVAILASTPMSASATCYIFEHKDYGGRVIKMEKGTYIENFQSINFNDMASSVAVRKGSSLKLYKHSGFKKMIKALHGDDDRGDRKFIRAKNDQASSARCGQNYFY